MAMAARQDRDVEQGVNSKEAGARDGGRPIPWPPCPRGQRQTGDEERGTDILNEMGVERPVSRTPGTVSYQRGPATSMVSPFRPVGIARMAAN